MATEGMVATPHYLASMAGVQMLRSGGNAIDAAIAANAVLTVVYPHMCSVGGDSFMMIWDPRERKLFALNGSGRSASGASIEALNARGIREMPERGAHPVTVPGAVHAWHTAHARFGSRPFAELFQDAIRYSENGFPVAPTLSASIGNYRELLERQAASAKQFMPNGSAPKPGDILRFPDLAGSFRLIGERGPEAVYGGPIGRAIAATLQSEGALVSEDDIAAHQSDWVEPLSTTYRGHEFFEMPPPTQGVVGLELANIAEGFDITAMGRNSAEQIHVLVEAKKLAFLDRDQHVTDPAFHDIPVARFISKEYAAQQRAKIDLKRAVTDQPDPHGGGDTIYLCVVDRDGLCVSLIQSIFNGFGSGLVAEGTGIVLQNRGASFTLDPEAANRLQPGKRPMHTLIPAMLFQNGEPEVVLGTMGAHGQAQTHIQLLCNLVDFGLEPQAAIESPRWVSGRGVADDPAHVLYLEEPIGEKVREELIAMGHDARMSPAFSSLMGHSNMIRVDRRRGVLMGGTDPRSDGAALGW
jgi:gamma-glutamyltranspeptidase / glutathione hydrolase